MPIEDIIRSPRRSARDIREDEEPEYRGPRMPSYESEHRSPPPPPVVEFTEPPLWSEYEDYGVDCRLRISRAEQDGRRAEIGYLSREAGVTALLQLGRHHGTYYIQPIDGVGRAADNPFSQTISPDHQFFRQVSPSATATMATQAAGVIQDPLARELLEKLSAAADRETQTLRAEMMRLQAEKDEAAQAVREKEMELERQRAEWANRQLDVAENLTDRALTQERARADVAQTQLTNGFAQIMAMMQESNNAERARMDAAYRQEQERNAAFQAMMTTWITQQAEAQKAAAEAEKERARNEYNTKIQRLEAEEQRLRDDMRERERERRAAAEREEQRRKEHAEDRIAIIEKLADDKSVFGNIEKIKELKDLLGEFGGGEKDDSFIGKITGLVKAYGEAMGGGGGFDADEMDPAQMMAMMQQMQGGAPAQIPMQPAAPQVAPQAAPAAQPAPVNRQEFTAPQQGAPPPKNPSAAGHPHPPPAQPPVANAAAQLPPQLQKQARGVLQAMVQRLGTSPPQQHPQIVQATLAQHHAILLPFCKVVGVSDALEEAGASRRMADAITHALNGIIPQDIPRRIKP